ncbi:iron-hydroxamate ABC transporter substrate-binding protein [Calidifontibacillus erzurumensis]|uniref:Iron-hydroxamate ABC transporter substrate-binding protein n=1 Tax=Calidifontibacillus erzurumensis TaxID=2741433 RepID=A0A8J8GAG6_9BACI|nr:iron-hydroxamate ABC transporter substrate-binding protein [Calidifontibacillus erzurumensis]NSL50209.1 iron-hydroxamate ABC transporter substrate-binding protein [Calidifontibacillus erzurumensis]
MKKLLMPFLLLLTIMLAACANNGEENSKNNQTGSEQNDQEEMITYQSENGPVEVPANPKRVIVIGSFTGNVLALDVPVVGVDPWAKMNPRFNLEGVEEVTDENLEKILELEPDLIIGLSTMKNVDKLKEIAPVVTYTYGKLDYLTQHLEIGKLLNKEAEAKAWIDDFKKRAQEAGEKIKEKIGEDATVTVVEHFDKELYVFGDNWGRGTEILYQEMKLNMPEKVKETALKQGYYTISLEVLPEFVGDYLIISKEEGKETSFMDSETYKNIPAVKNNRVFVANSKEFYFNDPITLEYQLDFFINSFLGN